MKVSLNSPIGLCSQRASVLKRSSKRGTVEDHAVGDMKRIRYSDSVPNITNYQPMKRAPAPVPLPSLMPAQTPVPISVPVPVLMPTPSMVPNATPVGLPSLANAPLLDVPGGLGMDDALDSSVLDLPVLSSDLDGTDVTLDLNEVLAAPSPSSSRKTTYQVHDVVFQAPMIPKAEWGRSVEAEPTQNLSLLDSNMSLYQSDEGE